ncbi:hypothetical protein J6590_063170 [Homalodisca vitripennis]|nr:hypothetical protein J6590_063170 [Homalodisca vitripennis]
MSRWRERDCNGEANGVALYNRVLLCNNYRQKVMICVQTPSVVVNYEWGRLDCSSHWDLIKALSL